MKRCVLGLLFIVSGVFNGVVAQDKTIPLIVHTRGIERTDISIIPLTGPNAYKAIVSESNIRPPFTTTLQIPVEVVPGDFIIRFDYAEKPGDAPYPSERQLILHKDIGELFVHPMYPNHPDSTYFSDAEIENNAWWIFSKESARRMKPLQSLTSFLHTYDDTQSEIFTVARVEWFKRVNAYNDWVAAQIPINQGRLVSAKMRFSLVPVTLPEGDERQRMEQAIQHFFDLMDPSDPIILNTREMQEWITRYVNLYGQLSTTTEIRDSLFSLAGVRAIEWAKQGHPLVYGYMVDYFFDGYEKNGIDAGIAILRPYLEDPNCMTRKKLAIQKRLDGMEKLHPGSPAPHIAMDDALGHPFDLFTTPVHTTNLLLFFWSADCDHCVDAIEDLNTWMSRENQDLTIIPIHIDDSSPAQEKWKNLIIQYPAWRHFNAENGINGKEATAYHILSTPFYVLIDSRTHIIKGTPTNIFELSELMK